LSINREGDNLVATILSLANQKGGVGKTTTTINLGAAMAELGKRILLVDFDPQGALSVGLGINPMSVDLTVYNLLLDKNVEPDQAILKTQIPDLEILPSNIDLSAAEIVLVSEVAREQSLKRALNLVRNRYDYILIDCPPSLGLLTVNALTASDGVIIPLECEYFALRGMALLMDTVDKVRDRLNPDLRLEGIIPTMYDSRTLHGREVLERVRSAFGEYLYKTVIRRTIRFAEAPVAGESILSYAAESRGADDYRALAKEVLGLVDQESQPAGSGRAVPDDVGGGGPAPDGPAAGTGVGAAGTSESGESDTEIYRQGDEGTRTQNGEREATPRGEGDVLLHP
jgi:chromosome partitioning protein